MSVKSFCAEVPCARSQSVLARGLHALLPPIEVVKASYCNANPDNPREWEVSPLPTIMSFQNCGILNKLPHYPHFHVRQMLERHRRKRCAAATKSVRDQITYQLLFGCVGWAEGEAGGRRCAAGDQGCTFCPDSSRRHRGQACGHCGH